MSHKQTVGMSVQEFFDQASDLSLNALVIDGIQQDIADKSRQALLHSMLLSNLLPEIRKGVISKDPKTPQEILNFALLEEKALHSVNPFYAMAGGFVAPDLSKPSPPVTPVACAAAYQPDGNQQKNKDAEISALRQQIDSLNTKLEKILTLQGKGENVKSQASTKNFSCFYCHEQNDHYARDCPLKQQHRSNRGRGRGFGGSNYNYNDAQRVNFTRGNQNQRGNFRGRFNQGRNFSGSNQNFDNFYMGEDNQFFYNSQNRQNPPITYPQNYVPNAARGQPDQSNHQPLN